MKPIQFVIAKPRARNHRALFDQELPFRARKEKSRVAYQRREKHQRRADLYDIE